MKKLFFIPMLAFIFSCQPTKITQTWTAKNVKPKLYNKVLVLGVLTDNDIELQTLMENHIADDLKELGYRAVAANKIFPSGTFVKGDTTGAVKAMEGKGFDAILTVILVDKDKERFYVPGKIVDYSNLNSYSRFDIYYNTVAERIYAPSYFGEETKYVWENNFYDLTTRQIIYSARSRSFDFTSKNTLAHTYGQLMVSSLIDKKILLKPVEE